MFVILLKVFIFDPLVVSIVSRGHSVERRELISEKNSCENVSLIVVFDYYFTNSLYIEVNVDHSKYLAHGIIQPSKKV